MQPIKLFWNAPGGDMKSNLKADMLTAIDSFAFRTDPVVSELVDNLILPSAIKKRSEQKCRGLSLTESIHIYKEPTVLFGSLANTYGDLICVDVDKYVSHAICGFHDSVVRVYNLKDSLSPFCKNSVSAEVLPRAANQKSMRGTISFTLSIDVCHLFLNDQSIFMLLLTWNLILLAGK